jgi:CheY-like chemotaxis protein/predicted Ser/Thr protein kinase
VGERPDSAPDVLRASFFAALPRYEYLGPLGQGGAGYVFKAIDRELNEVIAIKVMGRAAGEERDTVLRRFKGEVILNRKISHPNICRLYDYGVAGDLPYLTMEFVDGRHLGTIMDLEGLVPAKTALNILKQLTRAVAAAHAAGIVHRDLKPANVMVRPSGGISVLDFGFAHDTTRTDPRITRVGTAVGTPHYMSPEQVQGHLVDERSDIYAIGAIAFELLSGRRMFTGSTFLSIAKKHLETPVSRDTLEGSGVPRELAATVLRCLEKKPENRFPSAAALAASFEALERLQGSRRPAVTPAVAAAARVKTAVHRRSAILRSGAPGRRPVVMVVDDEELVRDLVCTCLRGGGFEAVPSASGEDALTLLETRTVDLILIDVFMPGVDGFDTVRVLKSRPEQAQIPVLFMSGLTEKNQVLFAGQTGAVDFLAKPLDLESMLKKVTAILGKPV